MDFIKDYVDYSVGLCSAPSKFHEMMAYVLLSQVIGRRATYHRSGPIVGPNLWALILAPSSTMAKSSAVGVGKRILREVYNGDFDHLIPVGGSSENFFERLEENPSGILFNSEFVSLLNWFKLHYANDVMPLLIDAYDQPTEIYKSIGTKHKNNVKKYFIKRPFINAYATSSYSLFNSVITPTLLDGGFLARWIIVREDAQDNFRLFTQPVNENKEIEFSNFLRELMLQVKEGPFDYDDNARKIYEDWFGDYLRPLIKRSTATFQPFLARRNTDVNKIAMIRSCLRGSHGIMNAQDIDEALCLIQQSLVDTEFVLSEKISMSPDETIQNKLCDLVSSFQSFSPLGAPHWKILKSSKMTSFNFNRFISTLVESRRIVVTENQIKKNKAFFYSINHNQE